MPLFPFESKELFREGVVAMTELSVVVVELDDASGLDHSFAELEAKEFCQLGGDFVGYTDCVTGSSSANDVNGDSETFC